MTVKEYRQKCEANGGAEFWAFLEDALEIWTNDACLGYMIVAAQGTGLPTEKITELIYHLKQAFDEITLDKAAERYRHSPF